MNKKTIITWTLIIAICSITIFALSSPLLLEGSRDNSIRTQTTLDIPGTNLVCTNYTVEDNYYYCNIDNVTEGNYD